MSAPYADDAPNGAPADKTVPTLPWNEPNASEAVMKTPSTDEAPRGVSAAFFVVYVVVVSMYPV